MSIYRRLVTVVIPCFNPEVRYLEETLQSLQRSSYQNYAVVLVNDGSTSTSFLEQLTNIHNADSSIRIIHHPKNRGLSAARNTGVACCHTPYFLFLDSDDQLAATFIEKCVNALEMHPRWSFCNSWVVEFGTKEHYWNCGFEYGYEFFISNQATSIALIRTEVDRAIGGHDEAILNGCEDWDYWLKMAANGFWGGTIPEYLIHYRRNEGRTYWANRDDLLNRFRVMMLLRSRYSRLWNQGFTFPDVFLAYRKFPRRKYWYRIFRQIFHLFRTTIFN